ncbi:hypothetical protein [Companilactobacillus muriivasis]|uniref:hypothetical protein n=1 Tax=Companilactobacillus muriivasis TaxID=3081444 RepID=UPI0030C719EA
MLNKKGKEWALSCVALSAAVLMGISTTVQADATNNGDTVNNSIIKTQSVNNGQQAVTQAANTVPRDGGHVSDDYSAAKNQLGYASNFHIFANEATLNTHTNGNLAVGQLYGNVNFGTNIKDGGLDKEVSYIQTPEIFLVVLS